jgi:ABC-type multidrug transport system permease subunit
MVTDDEYTSRMINTLPMLFFMLTSGGLANNATQPAFIKILTYISPSRYFMEALYRCFSNGVEEHQRNNILELFGFTLGSTICIAVLFGFFFLYIFLSYVTINVRNRTKK